MSVACRHGASTHSTKRKRAIVRTVIVAENKVELPDGVVLLHTHRVAVQGDGLHLSRWCGKR